MLLNDRCHRRWCVVVLAGAALAFGPSLWCRLREARWPDGASLLGLIYGGLTAAIILFECLLWVKKRKPFRTMRGLGPAVVWMRAHIWLGLLCLPLAVLHSGFHLGGWLTTGLALVFALVIVSGVTGALLQHWMPRQLTDQVGEETIHSQIDTIMHWHTVETACLIDDVCGLPERPLLTAVEHVDARRAVGQTPEFRTLTTGGSGHVRGTVLATRPAVERIDGAEPLRTFFRDEAAEYLLHGRRGTSRLLAPARAKAYFSDLGKRLPAAALPVLYALRDQCDRRRQLDRQARMHFWLHNWLWLHLPLSTALVVLVIVHALSAWRYH